MPTSMEGNVKILFRSGPARFVWTTMYVYYKACEKKSGWVTSARRAARFLDEVEREVDGNISREAGRLRIFRGSWWRWRSRLFGRQRSRPVYVKGMKLIIRQFEAGSMTVCEDVMEKKKKLWNATRSLSAAHADVSHLKEELENHKLYYIPG